MGIKQHWGKWWSKFFKWVFFPPVVLFFLYVTIMTGAAIQANGNTYHITSYASTSNTFWGSISEFFTNAIAHMILPILQVFMLGGLAIGGIMVADKLASEGGKQVVSAAAGFRKRAIGVMKQRGTQAGTAPLRRPTGQKITRGLQRGVKPFSKEDIEGTKSGFKRFMKRATNVVTAPGRIPYLGKPAAQALGGLGQSLEERGGTGAAEAATAGLKGMSTDRLIEALPRMGLNFQDRAAALKQISKDKRLDDVPDIQKYIGGQYASSEYDGDRFKNAPKGSDDQKAYESYQDYKKIKAAWDRSGQGKELDNLREKAGIGEFGRNNESGELAKKQQGLENQAKENQTPQEKQEHKDNEEVVKNLEKIREELAKQKEEAERQASALRKELRNRGKNAGFTGSPQEADIKSRITTREAEFKQRAEDIKNNNAAIKEARDKNLTIDKAGESRLDEVKQKELDKIRTKLRDNAEKRDKFVREMDAEDKADIFDDRALERKREKLKKDGKPEPLYLSKDSIKKLRETIVESMAKSQSSFHMNELLKELSKRNVTSKLDDVIKDMKKNNELKFNEIRDALTDGRPTTNAQMAEWIHTHQGKEISDLAHSDLFGIEPSGRIKEKIKNKEKKQE